MPSRSLRCSNSFFGPLADLFRRDRHIGDLAILGRAELRLAFIEEGRERLRRGRVDRAGLSRAELHIFDRALLVLEAAQRLHQRVRRRKSRGDGVRQLPTQRNALLVGEVSRLAITELPDDHLETLRVERAVHALEVRVSQDHAHGLGVGLSEAELAGLLIQRCLGDGLLQHLSVEAEGARLLLGQWTAELAADLLQAIIVDLAELV